MAVPEKTPEEQFPPPYTDDREKKILESALARKRFGAWEEAVRELARDPKLTDEYKKFDSAARLNEEGREREERGSSWSRYALKRRMNENTRFVLELFYGLEHVIWMTRENEGVKDQKAFEEFGKMFGDLHNYYGYAVDAGTFDAEEFGEDLERLWELAQKAGIPNHLLNVAELVKFGRHLIEAEKEKSGMAGQNILNMSDKEIWNEIKSGSIISSDEIKKMLTEDAKNYSFLTDWLKSVYEGKFPVGTPLPLKNKKSEFVENRTVIEHILNFKYDFVDMVKIAPEKGITKLSIVDKAAEKIKQIVDLLVEEGVSANLLTQEAFKKRLEGKKIK